MDDILDGLKTSWDDAKKSKEIPSVSAEDLILKSKQKMKRTVILYAKNVLVLVLTLVGISCFFIFVAPFQETMSHIGIALMIGGLILRIAIECHSIYRSSRIDLSSSATKVNKQYLNFYAYRKRIDGPITIAVLIAYSLGYYMLMPEFSIYFSPEAIALLASSYLLAALIFGYFIRRAIKDEMKYLNEIIELHKELVE